MRRSDEFGAPPMDVGAAATTEVVTIRALNVTGTQELPLEVRRDLPAEEVARSIAELMSLPQNVPWALRADSSAYLDDRVPIGEQLEPGATVTVTPKTHLGAKH